MAVVVKKQVPVSPMHFQKLERHSLTQKQSGCLYRSETEQNCRRAEESCSLHGLGWLVVDALGVKGRSGA